MTARTVVAREVEACHALPKPREVMAWVVKRADRAYLYDKEDHGCWTWHLVEAARWCPKSHESAHDAAIACGGHVVRIVRPSRDWAKARAAMILAEACVDWPIDTGECHFCTLRADGGHDEDCPVQSFLDAKPDASPEHPRDVQRLVEEHADMAALRAFDDGVIAGLVKERDEANARCAQYALDQKADLAYREHLTADRDALRVDLDTLRTAARRRRAALKSDNDQLRHRLHLVAMPALPATVAAMSARVAEVEADRDAWGRRCDDMQRELSTAIADRDAWKARAEAAEAMQAICPETYGTKACVLIVGHGGMMHVSDSGSQWPIETARGNPAPAPFVAPAPDAADEARVDALMAKAVQEPLPTPAKPQPAAGLYALSEVGYVLTRRGCDLLDALARKP